MAGAIADNILSVPRIHQAWWLILSHCQVFLIRHQFHKICSLWIFINLLYLVIDHESLQFLWTKIVQLSLIIIFLYLSSMKISNFHSVVLLASEIYCRPIIIFCNIFFAWFSQWSHFGNLSRSIRTLFFFYILSWTIKLFFHSSIADVSSSTRA